MPSAERPNAKSEIQLKAGRHGHRRSIMETNDCDDTCCRPADGEADALRDTVREGYGRIAQGRSVGVGGGCCGAAAFAPDALTREMGYTSDELATTPDGANMGLSCGNPTALASLRSGEVVLDLGAGGGFDC